MHLLWRSNVIFVSTFLRTWTIICCYLIIFCLIFYYRNESLNVLCEIVKYWLFICGRNSVIKFHSLTFFHPNISVLYSCDWSLIWLHWFRISVTKFKFSLQPLNFLENISNELDKFHTLIKYWHSLALVFIFCFIFLSFQSTILL